MTYAPVEIEGFTFALYEYVWDLTWEAPALVVGVQGDLLTVAEIGPDRSLGRVAHRREAELSRYVKLIVPEAEAEAVQSALFAESIETHDLIASFLTRLREARERRGLTDEG